MTNWPCVNKLERPSAATNDILFHRWFSSIFLLMPTLCQFVYFVRSRITKWSCCTAKAIHRKHNNPSRWPATTFRFDELGSANRKKLSSTHCFLFAARLISGSPTGDFDVRFQLCEPACRHHPHSPPLLPRPEALTVPGQRENTVGHCKPIGQNHYMPQ